MSAASAEEQKWKSGLTPIQEGLYLEGIVKDLDSILELHKQETVSTFGCRTSYRTKVCTYRRVAPIAKEGLHGAEA